MQLTYHLNQYKLLYFIVNKRIQTTRAPVPIIWKIQIPGQKTRRSKNKRSPCFNIQSICDNAKRNGRILKITKTLIPSS